MLVPIGGRDPMKRDARPSSSSLPPFRETQRSWARRENFLDLLRYYFGPIAR